MYSTKSSLQTKAFTLMVFASEKEEAEQTAPRTESALKDVCMFLLTAKMYIGEQHSFSGAQSHVIFCLSTCGFSRQFTWMSYYFSVISVVLYQGLINKPRRKCRH